MTKLINKYLNSYIIVHSKFYNKSKDISLVGWKLVEDLEKVFNVSEEDSIYIITKWLKRRRYQEFEIEKFNLNKPIVELSHFNRQQLPNRFAPPYEPKRSDRWVVIFPENYNLPSFCVRNTQRPRMVRVNGILEWEDILMVFNDPIAPSITRGLVDLTYPPNLGIITYTLEMLDPTGYCVERWEISGIISRLDFGELTYNDSDITTVSLNISVTECRLLF